MSSPSRRAFVAASALTALGLSGCSSDPEPPPEATPTDPAGPRNSPRLVLTQTEDEATRTLETVQKLDDHPLWSMTWYGEGARIDENPPLAAGGDSPMGFGCTLWVATGTEGRPLVGRNWDWEHGPGLVLSSRTDQARTLTLTDMAFLGLGPQDPLDRLDEEGRSRVLRAQGGQVEGMNEHGVFMGLAADQLAIEPFDDTKPLVGGLGVQRLVLDEARTTAEAVEIVRSVDLDFTGGPGLHYLVADRHGAAAVIECDGGEYYVEERPEDQPWMCLENFHMAAVPVEEREQQRRWSTCARTLGEAGGVVDLEGALDLLDEVRQGITQWSSVYDLAAGTVEVRTSAGRHSLRL